MIYLAIGLTEMRPRIDCVVINLLYHYVFGRSIGCEKLKNA